MPVTPATDCFVDVSPTWIKPERHTALVYLCKKCVIIYYQYQHELGVRASKNDNDLKMRT